MKKTYIILLLAFISNAVLCGPGTTGADFLKIGVGARPSGMGEAFTAVAADVNSMFWNPAGIAGIKEKQLLAMHSEWLAGIRYEVIGYAGPVTDSLYAFSAGGYVMYLYAGGLEKRTTDTLVNEGEFGFNNIAVDICLGWKLEGLKFGTNIKYISQTIDSMSAAGLAFDAGCLFDISNDLTAGVSVQNIGAKVKFTEEDPLPLNYKIGFSYRMLNKDLLIALDANIPAETKASVHAGAEYTIRFDSLNIIPRAGFKSDTLESMGKLSCLTAGLGFSFTGLSLDYAFTPYKDLGNAHRVSITVKF
jgi:hypothetical protein